MIPRDKWEWYGKHGHLIVGDWCRYHLATRVGTVLVSTVGQYVPDAPVREILARSRGVVLDGQGNDRETDYLRKVGYEYIGAGRTYETMVFRLKKDEKCEDSACGCQMPVVADWMDLECRGYTTAKEAHAGHYALCEKWARSQD